MFLTVGAGLAIRFVPLGLPYFVVKYGGSMFWALMIYWIVSTLLCHAPALDAFRLTLPGILLLGRFFSVWDIVAYWLAISIGAIIDRALIRQSDRSAGSPKVPADS